MQLKRKNISQVKYAVAFHHVWWKFFILLAVSVQTIFHSCESAFHDENWYSDENRSICEFVRANQEEYSKFSRLMSAGKLLNTLCGYNPYGEGYTLFLPNNEAIDDFIENSDYEDFDELIKDSTFISNFTRYHVVNRKIHTNEFPFGALKDTTLSGQRLIIGFYTENDNAVLRVNNEASIVRSNLEMVNGFVHAISSVLTEANEEGYDWLQKEEDYSILAQAMEKSGIRNRLWFSRYTILAEHDSIYNRYGIFSIDDLIERIADANLPLTDRSNPFYQFAAYHLLRGEYYLNDFRDGADMYRTLGDERVRIDVGFEIKINPGVDIFGIEVNNSGDTTNIDYIRVIWEGSNIMTKTGPVHAIRELLVDKPIDR